MNGTENRLDLSQFKKDVKKEEPVDGEGESKEKSEEETENKEEVVEETENKEN